MKMAPIICSTLFFVSCVGRDELGPRGETLSLSDADIRSAEVGGFLAAVEVWDLAPGAGRRYEILDHRITVKSLNDYGYPSRFIHSQDLSRDEWVNLSTLVSGLPSNRFGTSVSLRGLNDGVLFVFERARSSEADEFRVQNLKLMELVSFTAELDAHLPDRYKLNYEQSTSTQEEFFQQNRAMRW